MVKKKYYIGDYFHTVLTELKDHVTYGTMNVYINLASVPPLQYLHTEN